MDSVPYQDIVLPSIDLSWDQGTVSGTFVAYNVYRRVAGTGDAGWERIAMLTSQAETAYSDYAVASRVVYEYAVTQSANVSGDILESTKQTPPVTGRVAFDWTYGHEVGFPDNWLCYFNLDQNVDVNQDVEFRTAWGRSAPTAFVGELDADAIQISGLPDIQRGAVWSALRSMATRQVVAASPFCFRIGVSGERWFAAIASLGKRSGERQYEAGLTLRQVYYEEAV